MVSVKHVLFGFSIVLFLSGCSSQPVFHQAVNSTSSSQTVNRSTSGANFDSEQLDIVIRNGSDFIGTRIQANSKVGVVSMRSSSENLSNYVVDSMIMHLINADFIVVERSKLDIIQREQQHQLSGEVSDATAIAIGQQLGVQYIISGSILPLGNHHSLGNR